MRRSLLFLLLLVLISVYGAMIPRVHATTVTSTQHVQLGFATSFTIPHQSSSGGSDFAGYSVSFDGTGELEVHLEADITLSYDTAGIVAGGLLPVHLTYTPTSSSAAIVVDATAVVNFWPGCGDCPATLPISAWTSPVSFTPPLDSDPSVVIPISSDTVRLQIPLLGSISVDLGGSFNFSPAPRNETLGLGGAVVYVAVDNGASLTPGQGIVEWDQAGQAGTQDVTIELPQTLSPDSPDFHLTLMPVLHWLGTSASINANFHCDGLLGFCDGLVFNLFSGNLGPLYHQYGLDTRVADAIPNCPLICDMARNLLVSRILAGYIAAPLLQPPWATISVTATTPPPLGRTVFDIQTPFAFSISASPSDRTALAGQTASYTVSLTFLQGAPATVALSVLSGLPPGALAEFNPGSVTATGTANLDVSTSLSSLGDFILTIQGEGGGVTHTTTVNLHVYDFAIAVSPSDATVLGGRMAIYAVTLRLLDGSSTPPPISLTASHRHAPAFQGLPSDAVSGFDSSSVTPTLGPYGVRTMLRVATAPSGSLGDFPFIVAGHDNTNPSGGYCQASANLHIYDFTVSVTPSDRTVLGGSSTTYTVTLVLTAGSSTPPAIPLSVGNSLPPDASGTFDSTILTPAPLCTGVWCPAAATTTLTVATASPPGGSVGDFTFTVSAFDSVSIGFRTATANLHIRGFTVTTTVTSITTVTSTTSATLTTSTIYGTITGTPLFRTYTTESPSATGTVWTTTTTTGPSLGTSTTVFTTIQSTYRTTVSWTSSFWSTETREAGVTTRSTLSSTTVGTDTALATTTNDGTVTVSETDTVNVLLSNIVEELHQLWGWLYHAIFVQSIETPVGQQVNQVVVTTTTPTTSTSTTSSVTVTVRLLDSGGNGLGGGVVQYYSAGWRTFGTTGTGGTTSMTLASGTYTFQIRYGGGIQQLSQNVANNPNVVFQTTLVTMSLVSSANAPLSGGAQYYADRWHTFGGGTTTTSMQLLPLTYTFQVSYGGASQQKSQNVATNPSVVFQTTLVTMQLLAHDGVTALAGGAQYHANGWHTFGSGTTTTSMELLPVTYTFQVSYGGRVQQLSQNVAGNPSVVFRTALVTMSLVSSANAPLSGGAQYYAGGWHVFGGGTTATSMELLPLSYMFQITYAGASEQKIQNIATNPNLVFQTTLVTMSLVSSTNAQLSGGAQYYADGWHTFGGGTTTTTMELLPITYTFQVSYGGATRQKIQNIATNALVTFQTVQVHSDSGRCTSYYAGGWRTFTQDMQLLPGTYTFRFSDGTRDTSCTLVVGAVKHIH